MVQDQSYQKSMVSEVECCAIMFLRCGINVRAELLLRYTFDEAFEGIDPVLTYAAPAACRQATRTNNTPADLTSAALNVAFDGNHYLNAGDLQAERAVRLTIRCGLICGRTLPPMIVLFPRALRLTLYSELRHCCHRIEAWFMINNSQQQSSFDF